MTGWLFALRSLYGAVLLLAPARALATLTRAPVDRPAANVARVLGARELVQAELVRRHPGRAAQLASAGVDGLHAATMFALEQLTVAATPRAAQRCDGHCAGARLGRGRAPRRRSVRELTAVVSRRRKRVVVRRQISVRPACQLPSVTAAR